MGGKEFASVTPQHLFGVFVTWKHISALWIEVHRCKALTKGIQVIEWFVSSHASQSCGQGRCRTSEIERTRLEIHHCPVCHLPWVLPPKSATRGRLFSHPRGAWAIPVWGANAGWFGSVMNQRDLSFLGCCNVKILLAASKVFSQGFFRNHALKWMRHQQLDNKVLMTYE